MTLGTTRSELEGWLTHAAFNAYYDLGAIRLSRLLERTAEYDLRVVRDGTQYSFLVVFVIDEDGVWRLWSF